MHTYISLLKGINVGGKHKLSMASLKNIYEMLGCAQVTTYIQSGNVIFKLVGNAKALENNVSQQIQEQWGYNIPLFIREASFFSEIIINNPFKDCDPGTLHVTLLGDITQQAKITEEVWGEDRFVVQENVIYVHCPHGYGKTKLNNSFFENREHTWATTRNWKTVCRLVELATTQYE